MSEKVVEKIDREVFREKLKKVQKVLKEYLKNPEKYEQQIEKSRKWIEVNCYQLLISDPSYYIENGIDSVLWKDRFYKPIEQERSKLKDKMLSINETNVAKLETCISEGIDFYTHLFQKLKSIPTIEDAPTSSTPFSKHTKIILNYSLFIHLGDLYRYKTQYLNKEVTNPTQMYGESEYFYKQAIALDPSNGLGHHQLAVLSSYQKAMCMCIYRYCRSLSCQTPVSSAIRNVKVQFQNNEKELTASRTGLNQPLDKKSLLNFFILEFIELQKYLTENVKSTDQFLSLLKDTVSHLSTLLKNDAISTPLVFRITVISIFAATDGWRVNDDGSQSQTTVLTRSCVFGWILLLSLMSCIIKYSFIHLPHFKDNQLTRRHIPSVYVFIEWLQLQNQDGYRPKYVTSEMLFSSTSQSKSSKEILLFLQCEQHCWCEVVELLNRIPLTDRIITDNSPLLYEVELRGFLPMRGKFDNIPSSKQLCEGSEADKRYLINICLSINKIIIDPRCPIKINRNSVNQFIIEPNSSIPNILTFISMEGDFSSVSMNGSLSSYFSNVEDEIPFYLMNSSVSMHSRNHSSSSYKSNSSLDVRSHSSSRSASNSSWLRRSSNPNLQHLANGS